MCDVSHKTICNVYKVLKLIRIQLPIFIYYTVYQKILQGYVKEQICS